MLRKLTKKRVLVISAIASLAIAAAAFAYLTATGSGDGNGSVTASTTPLSITFSQPDFTQLDQTKTVTIYATNNGTSPQYINSLTAFSVAPANTTTCPAGSFTAATPSITAQQVAADGAPHPVGTVDVTFANVASAQNGCVGSNTVAYSATSN